jgi:hypothetical protein
MKTIDLKSMGDLVAQLHVIDAAEKTLQDASRALDAATKKKGEPARLDELRQVMSMAVPDYVIAKMDLVELVRKALSGPADDPFAPLLAALTDYANLAPHSRARRHIDMISTASDTREAQNALHRFIGYLDALFDEKLLDFNEHDVLMREGEQAWRDWKPTEGVVE